MRLPLGVARLQATCLELGCSLIGRPSPLTRDQLLMLDEDNTGDPRPAVSDFQLPSRSVAVEIAKYLR
jgi:hypothetical protein